MRVLILGGSLFIGRYIAEALLAGGHAVTTFSRGVTPDALPAEVERLRGDRDAGPAALSALAGRAWDACVDVSGYTPRQVRPSAEALRERVGRYLYISSVSAYGDPPDPPVYEDHPRMAPAAEDVTEVDGETYGPLKVACEDIVQSIYGDRATLFRPQVVVGPHDPTGRYPYWVQRAAQGGEMLAPGDGSDYVQVVDVRDLARFARVALERGLGGSFNLAGPRITWAELLGILGAERLYWVPAAVIAGAGLTFVELPLYRPAGGARSSLMHVSNERASAAGLTLTDPAATAADVRAWLAGAPQPPALTPEREAELIAAARRQMA